MVRTGVAVSALALLLLQAVRIQVTWAEEVGDCGQYQVAEPQPQPQPHPQTQPQPQPQVAYAAAASAAANPLMVPCMGGYDQYGQYGQYGGYPAAAAYGAYSPYGYSYPYSYPTTQAYGYYSPHQQQEQQVQQVQQVQHARQRPPDPGQVDCTQCAAAACSDSNGSATVAGPVPEQRAPLINADILAAPIASMLARIVGGVKPDRSDSADHVTVQMDNDDDAGVGGGCHCPCEAPTAGSADGGCVAAPTTPAAQHVPPHPPPPPPPPPVVCDAMEHLLAFGVPQRPADTADASDVEEGCLYAGPTQCPRPPTDPPNHPFPPKHDLDLVVAEPPPCAPSADCGGDVEARQEGPRVIETPPVYLPGKCGNPKPLFGSSCGCGNHR